MSKILIVDDVEMNLELLEALLVGAGFETKSALNGVEALQVLKSESIDMIISDILMPQMDGYQLCRECKVSTSLREIPFVFYTATYTDDRDREFALGLGAEAFVIKPTEKERFMEIINDVLDQYKSGALKPTAPVSSKTELTYYKEYNQRLINKLEKKVADLEIAKQALALEHQRTQEEARANVTRLESLQRISQYKAATVQELLDFALHEAITLTKSKIGYIYFYDDESGELRINSWSKQVEKERNIKSPQTVYSLEATGIWGEVVRQKKPITFNDFQAHHPLQKGCPEGHAHIVKFLTIPVLMDDKVVSVIGVANKEEDYNQTDMHQLQLLMNGVWKTKAKHESDQERARLTAAIDQAHEGISILDRDGIVQYANSAMRSLWGNRENENIEEKSFKCIDGYFQKEAESIWGSLNENTIWSGRISHERPDGSVIDCEATFTPIRDKNGDLVNAVLISRDITQELKMEERLRQSQKMEAIGTLAGGIAHDFNNILSGIFGFAELSLGKVSDKEDVFEYLTELLQACERARDLVGQILTFSRQTEQEKAPLHVLPLISETCKFLRASLPASIQIRQAFNSDSDYIMGDTSQIHQVLMNLCTNAGHVMRERGGILEIVTEKKFLDETEILQFPNLTAGQYLQISVKDSGAGIPSDIIPRIFEPYYTTKEMGEGTGLGLAVVHGIVTDHGGVVRVYSERGKGTVFHVLLPLIEEENTLVSIFPEGDLVAIGKERIMIVDDEYNVQRVAKVALERLGYTVVTFRRASEAIEMLRKDNDSVDLIITDKTMPEMMGFELADEVMKIRPDIPIILCTGFLEKNDSAKAEALGIKDIIVKPIQIRQLAYSVRKALESSMTTHRT